MAFAVSLAARLHRIPIVHTFHIVASQDRAHGFVRNRTEARLIKSARPALVTALNEHDLEVLRALGLKAVLLPNGLDMNVWRPISPRAEDGRFVITSVGRLEKQKDYELLIRASRLLADNVDIRIVGDGSLRPHLQQLITSSGVGNRVSLLGPKSVAEIRELFAGTDAVVICSLFEAMPLSLLEAWASGLPVITTEVGMVKGPDPEQARAVHLVTSRDPATLAAAIRRLQDDRSYRRTLVEAGFDEVKQYSWDQVHDLLEDYYGQVTHR